MSKGKRAIKPAITPLGKNGQLQYSCLENSMDRGAWCATVQGLDTTEPLTHTHTHTHTHTQMLSEGVGGWIVAPHYPTGMESM